MKKCKQGYYYCYKDKKCKKIPTGYRVGLGGWLRREKDEEKEEETKKNGNGANGNGNGDGDSSGSTSGGGVSEGWSAKYKKSIDCDNPKGFSQRAHCQGRKKVNESSMSPAQKRKDTMLKKKYDKSDMKKNMIDQYGKEEGTKIYFATIRKQAMKEEKKGDHEISMAQSQLKKSEQNIKKLRKALGTKERNIPAWVQAKITDTEHNTDAAAGYMDEGKRDGKSAKSKDYSLRDWFKGGGWVQTGGKYDGKPCAKQPGQKTKPFCRDADDRASMSKDERERRAKKKRREDPNPNRKGKAKMVTESYSNWRQELIESEQLDEGLRSFAGRVINRLIRGGRKSTKVAKPASTYPLPKRKGPPSPGSDPNFVPPKQTKGYSAHTLDDPKYKMGPSKSDTRSAAQKALDDDPWTKGALSRDDVMRARRDRLDLNNSYEVEGDNVEEGKKDACYHKVKSRYSVWPSAYASGALVKCRKVGAKNWGNKTKKEGYEFSNWRDDFTPTEYETVDLIKADPIQVPPSNLQKIEEAKKCWKGYKKTGTQKLFGKTYNRCVKKEEVEVQEGVAGALKLAKPLSKRVGAALLGAGVLKSKKKMTIDDFPDFEMNDDMENQLKALDKAKKDGAFDEKQPKGKNPKRGKDLLDRLSRQMPTDDVAEDWQKSNRKDGVDGMSQKSVDAYKRENPGSKLQTAVTGKVKKGSKDAKRRKSFCSRSKGQKDMHNIDCTKTPDKKICKARKRWRC